VSVIVIFIVIFIVWGGGGGGVILRRCRLFSMWCVIMLGIANDNYGVLELSYWSMHTCC